MISSPLNGADPDIHERWRHEMRSKPFMDDYLPEDAPEVSPIADALLSQPHFGGAGNVDEDDDIEEDDGQPSEYEEWQDYMGGDDWDYGQCDDLGY